MPARLGWLILFGVCGQSNISPSHSLQPLAVCWCCTSIRFCTAWLYRLCSVQSLWHSLRLSLLWQLLAGGLPHSHWQVSSTPASLVLQLINACE